MVEKVGNDGLLDLPNSKLVEFERTLEASQANSLVRFDNAFLETSENLFDAGVSAIGKFGSGLYKYATDTDYIQNTNKNIGNGVTSVINGVDNYLTEWGKKPEKPLTDIVSAGVNAASSVGEWHENYKKESSLGFGPEYLGDSTAKAFPAVAGATISVAMPTTKILKQLSNLEPVSKEQIEAINSGKVFIPEGTPNFNDKITHNISPAKQEFNENIFEGLDYIDEYGGVATNRVEAFEMARDMQGKKGLFAISPNVDKKGLTQYLTLLGDNSSNKQEFSTIKFIYNTDRSYSPTFVYSSNNSAKIDIKRFENFLNFTNSKLALGFHNHPFSVAAPSFPDAIQGVRSPYKSSLLGAVIRDETGTITHTQVVRWSHIDALEDYENGNFLNGIDSNKYTMSESRVPDSFLTSISKRSIPLGAGLGVSVFSLSDEDQNE